jgi:tRNA threonylcarbamoyladenosine biosynthesis protein TsaB
MPLLLHTDTATENATVAISKDDGIIDFITNDKQKDHASFLHPAIKGLTEANNISVKQLDAISVTEGPGSYTGLRVGMSAAKGLCYALQVPLITLSTLTAMALSVIEDTSQPELFFYCPMIDARRMEVFTAMFDHQLNEIQSPRAIVLEPGYFEKGAQHKRIIFSGNGAKKMEQIATHSPNFFFSEKHISPSALLKLAIKKFRVKMFADVSNADPLYIKEFYTVKK